MVRPYLPMSQPMPPPSVSPAMPVVETTATGGRQTVKRRRHRLNSRQREPGLARTVRSAGVDVDAFIGERSIISPPSVTARPATPWPPPRTAISRPAVAGEIDGGDDIGRRQAPGDERRVACRSCRCGAAGPRRIRGRQVEGGRHRTRLRPR